MGIIGPTFQKGDDPDMKPAPGPPGRLRRWLKEVWEVLSYPAHPPPFDPLTLMDLFDSDEGRRYLATRHTKQMTLADERRLLRARKEATMFKVGDVVRLKRGGLKMTVENLMGLCTGCVWFVGTTLTRDVFPTDRLQPESPTVRRKGG